MISGELIGRSGTRLRTLTWLPEGDPVAMVLILHGFSEHAGRYRELAESLSGRGFAVLAFDQRGHGMSEGTRGQLPDFEWLLDDLATALSVAQTDLPGGGPLFLFAHSLGGLVALRYLQTRDHSLQGAVISAPWLGTTVRIPLWKRFAKPILERVAPALTLENAIRPELLSSDPECQRAYLADPLIHRRVSAGLVAAVERAQREALESDVDPSLPVLAIVPTGDPVTDQRLAESYFRNLGGSVTVQRLEGVRHEPLNDIGREAVVRMIEEFFEALLPHEPEDPVRVRS